MGVQLVDGAGGVNKVTIDVNGRIQVNAPMVPSDAGYLTGLMEFDAGSSTGVRIVGPLQASEKGRLQIGRSSAIFSESFASGALNTTLWAQAALTMTIAPTNGYLVLNSGSSVATGTYAKVNTFRNFSSVGDSSVEFSCVALVGVAPQVNNVTEWGLGLATTNGVPLDGALFRLNAAGEFRCVLNNNGVETTSGVLNATTLLGVGVSHTFQISLGRDKASFFIDGVMVSQITLALSGRAQTTCSNYLGAFFRTYNSGATTLAQQLKVASVGVNVKDLDLGRNIAQISAGMGGHATQGQTGGTLGSTSNITNNLALAAATALSNTTAVVTGLGGQCTVNPSLAVGTDGIICSYRAPLGTAVLPGKTLMITGVRISALVTTVLNAAAIYGMMTLCYGHTAVSLATADGVGTKAPRRVSLGWMNFASAAPVGTQVTDIVQIFQTPIPVQSGEYVAIAMKNLGANSGGGITFLVAFDGYWE